MQKEASTATLDVLFDNWGGFIKCQPRSLSQQGHDLKPGVGLSFFTVDVNSAL